MNSTIVIGIGTTGLNIIEQAQQNHYEFTGKNRPEGNTEYIYIETDTNSNSRKTASGETDIEKIDFPLQGVEVDINNLTNNQNVDSSWIPSLEGILEIDAGAGGMPAYGRLAFWSNSNYNRLRKAILAKYEKIGGDNNTQVLIVGSLTGGTGSGICVDVAYLVKSTLVGLTNINAILLLPNIGKFEVDKSIFINSLSATWAIDHYTNPNNIYKVTYPGGAHYEDVGPPFQFCQYISQDFSRTQASITTLGELLKVAGLKTMLHFIGTDTHENGVSSLLDRRRIDSVGSDRIKNVISSGFHMIQYPKAQLKELLSIKITSDLFNKLIDNENYVNRLGTKVRIENEKIHFQIEAKRKFEEILESIVEELDSLKAGDGDILTKSFDNDVTKIMSKKIDLSENEFIHQRFSSNTSNNYHELLKGNSSKINDKLINKVEKLIVDTTENYKNFHVTEIFIDTIINHIDDLIAFYKNRYKLIGNDEGWDIIAGEEITEIFKDKISNELSFQKRSFLNYTFNSLSFLLKTNILIPQLEILKKDLSSNKEVRSLENKTLPSKGLITRKIKKIHELVHGEGKDGKMTLKRRESELSATLDQYKNCFKMLYAKGSKNADLEKAYEDYQKAGKLTYSDIFEQDIWSYTKNEMSKLYNDVLKTTIIHMNEQAFFNEHNLKTIISNLPEDQIENSELKNIFKSPKDSIKTKLTPAMVKLKTNLYAFSDDPCARLIILSSNHLNYNELFDQYKVNIQDDNTIDIESLSDVIIFYQEYGFLGEAQGHLKTPKNLFFYDNLISYLKEKIDEPEFLKKKFPYFSEEQVRKKILQNNQTENLES